MENRALISILIVTYNPGVYLKNTLRSCLDQTYRTTEILILDNNSSEDISDSITGVQGYRITDTIEMGNTTLFQVCETANPGKCQSVKLIRSTENLGPYRGLNLLLKEAKGEYIGIQDHDDIWHPEKLEKQMDFLTSHPQYIGCGTNTIMYYEADGKYFEYYLGKENYYTVHPSLLFRNNGEFRYDTSETEYMCDAWSLKHALCQGEKRIYNLDTPLTLHLIKKSSGNYSYRWHTLNWVNIRRAYNLHALLYATMTIGWEIKRKIVYPILNTIGLGTWINPIERIPFRLMGNQIKTTQRDEWWGKYM